PDRRPPALEPPSRRRSWDAGIGYSARFRGDEGWAHGPRASVLVRFAGQLEAAASIRSALPVTRTLDSIDLAIYGATLGIGLGWKLGEWRGLALDVVSGPAAEWIHYSPVSSRDAAVVAAGAESEIRPAWDFAVRAIFEEPFRWALVAECQVALTPPSSHLSAPRPP